MDSQTLMNSIASLSEDEKVQLGKMLGLEKNPVQQNIETLNTSNNNALEQLEQRYQNEIRPINPSQCATSAEVAQVKNKVETVQLELIDIVRHLKDYTKRYMDVHAEQKSAAMLEYVDNVMGQNKQLEQLKKMKEDAELADQQEIIKEQQRENTGGLIGNVARGAFNVVKGAVSGANSLLNTASEGIGNMINNTTNSKTSNETPVETPIETPVETPIDTNNNQSIQVSNQNNLTQENTQEMPLQEQLSIPEEQMIPTELTPPLDEILNKLTNAVNKLK